MHPVAKMLFVSAVVFSLPACTAVQNQRGYVPEIPVLENIVIGGDTRISVSQKLGNPTLNGAFDDNTWYYVSSFDVQAAFFPTQSLEREIYAVEFSPEGQVASVEVLGLDDGRTVGYVGRETPTSGRDLTFLQQIFNAVPGNIGGNQNTIPGQNPGGTGIPPPF